MKVRLKITKRDASLYEGTHDVTDAESLAKAWFDAWNGLKQRQMQRESSVGALMEHLDDGVLDQLIGAQVSLDKA
jgi:hypothetical protein